jgi:autotransporter translocation and assembly factor TamB
MATATGTWNLEAVTPFGSQALRLELTESGAAVTGTASVGSTSAPLRDGRLVGDQLTFEIDVTDPMELTLAAKLTIDGDSLSGKAKAKGKLFPSAKVTGTRA